VLGRRPLIYALLKRRALVAPLKDEIATERAYFPIVGPRAAKRAAVRTLEAWLIAQAQTLTTGRPLDLKPMPPIAAETGR